MSTAEGHYGSCLLAGVWIASSTSNPHQEHSMSNEGSPGPVVVGIDGSMQRSRLLDGQLERLSTP